MTHLSPSPLGPLTGEPGKIAYKTICGNVKNAGWTEKVEDGNAFAYGTMNGISVWVRVFLIYGDCGKILYISNKYVTVTSNNFTSFSRLVMTTQRLLQSKPNIFVIMDLEVPCSGN